MDKNVLHDVLCQVDVANDRQDDGEGTAFIPFHERAVRLHVPAQDATNDFCIRHRDQFIAPIHSTRQSSIKRRSAGDLRHRNR